MSSKNNRANINETNERLYRRSYSGSRATKNALFVTLLLVVAALAGATLFDKGADTSSAAPGDWTLSHTSGFTEVRTILNSETNNGSVTLEEGYIYI
ncbi:hypothetical protein [Candidatus Methanoplasma termitum]|nr:hypothetical protein [Candidatus Methanoplasma termitum]